MTVNALEIQVKLLSPGLFGGRAADGNIRKSLPYIPGAVLRGALAWYARSCTEVDDMMFGTWFLNEKIRWPELHLDGDNSLKSVRVCKYFGDPDLPDGHPCVDDIWFEPADRPQVCGKCGEPLRRSAIKRVATCQITRTAIDPVTRTARDGSLHSIVALAEGQIFKGTLTADISVEEWLALDAWLRNVAKSPPALGGGRSAGLGAITMSLAAPAERISVADRLRQWNGGTNSVRFAVSLTSPAIIRDTFWRYQRTLDCAAVAVSSPRLEASRFVAGWSDVIHVGGWNEAAGLPKENALAIDRGSAFLFETSLAMSDAADALESLERCGIGERCAEGFGNVSVCDIQHLQCRPL